MTNSQKWVIIILSFILLLIATLGGYIYGILSSEGVMVRIIETIAFGY